LRYLKKKPPLTPPKGENQKKHVSMKIIIKVQNICFSFSPVGGNPEGKGDHYGNE
jgi:hypothetical protein